MLKKRKTIFGIPSTSHNLIDLKKFKGRCSMVGSPRCPHHMCLYELWDSSSGKPHWCSSGTCGIIHYRVTGCGVSKFIPTPPPLLFRKTHTHTHTHTFLNSLIYFFNLTKQKVILYIFPPPFPLTRCI